MDELDRIVLAESLKVYGVSTVAAKGLYFVSPHPIDELLKVASDRIPKPVDMLVSEEGSVEHFFLTGLHTLPIIFSARFIALSERLTRIDNDAYSKSLKLTMSEGIAYDVISEFLLTRRNIVGAATSYMKARIALANISFLDSKTVFGAGADLWSMEARKVDEIYITDFFFGLAHELGHAIQDCQRDGPPWCSDEKISDYITIAANASQGDAGLTYRLVGPSATLNIERLRHEAGADIEGCRLLARAARSMIEKYGEPGAELNVQRLFGSMLFHYSLLGYLNGCRRAAEVICLEKDDAKRAIELLQQPLGFAVRQMILQDHLPLVAAEAMGVQDGGMAATFGSGPRDIGRIEPKMAAFFKKVWGDAYHALFELNEVIDAGLLLAIEYFNTSPTIDDTIDLAAEYCARRAGGEFEIAERQFFKLANVMKLSDDDLDLLQSTIELGHFASGRHPD